jgi:choline dehydrogenase-like flavoprotein
LSGFRSGVSLNSIEACDILVVGSGPGGAITAALLAEHGRDVVMLDDGAHWPVGSCEPFGIDEMTQKYRCGGLNPAMGKPAVAFVEARCVGGGSEINSGLYHRTPDAVLEQWRQDYEVQGVSPKEMGPHFAACEEAVSVCRTPGSTPLASCKLQEGANQLGWYAMEVPRWAHYDGSTGPDGCPIGTRQSMTRTFVPRAMEAGCRLAPEVRAQRIEKVSDGWKAHVKSAAGAGVIRANTVFVCAGAVQTPAILRNSGFTQNVGNSLAMHPTVKVVARFDEEVNHEQLGVPVHQVKEFSPRMSFGCSISSPPYLALAMAEHPDYESEVRQRWREMAIYYAMITGPTVGKVRSLPGCDDPLIRYSLGPEDWRDLATGLRRLCKLLLAAGAKELYPSIRGSGRICSEEDLIRIPAALPPDRTSVMTIHLFSSCPMGELRSRCAVDSYGRVHGTQGLLVSDAGLICTAPGVNPQGTVMALARRNALHFLGRD